MIGHLEGYDKWTNVCFSIIFGAVKAIKKHIIKVKNLLRLGGIFS